MRGSGLGKQIEDINAPLRKVSLEVHFTDGISLGVKRIAEREEKSLFNKRLYSKKKQRLSFGDSSNNFLFHLMYSFTLFWIFFN